MRICLIVAPPLPIIRPASLLFSTHLSVRSGVLVSTIIDACGSSSMMASSRATAVLMTLESPMIVISRSVAPCTFSLICTWQPDASRMLLMFAPPLPMTVPVCLFGSRSRKCILAAPPSTPMPVLSAERFMSAYELSAERFVSGTFRERFVHPRHPRQQRARGSSRGLTLISVRG